MVPTMTRLLGICMFLKPTLMTVKTFTQYSILLLTLLNGIKLYPQNLAYNRHLQYKKVRPLYSFASEENYEEIKKDTSEVLIYSFEEGRVVPYAKRYINTEDSKTSAVYICEGNSVMLSTPDFGSDAVYSWRGPQGFSSLSQQIKLEKITPFQAGYYNFSIQKNGSTTIGKVKLLVKEKPRAIATGGAFCYGETVKISAFDAGAGVSYKWTQPPTDFYETTPEVNIENLNVGEYTYYLSVMKNGCKSLDTANVIVKPAPVALANNANIKVGETAKLEAHDAGGDANYIWKGPFLSSVNRKNLEVSGLPAGKFLYILNVVKNGCSSMNVSVVEVGKENEAKASIKN